MVVADGALNYVPFEVLLKSGDSGDFSSLGYLVKTNEVIYAPSASVVGAIKQQRTRATGKTMLIIADPVFNYKDAQLFGPPACLLPLSGLAQKSNFGSRPQLRPRDVRTMPGRESFNKVWG